MSRSWVVSKRINISSKIFYRRVAPPVYGNIPMGTPLTGIQVFNHQARQEVSVAVVLQRKTEQARSRTIHNHGGQWIVRMIARLDITPKTTEWNRILRTNKSEAEVTNNKKLHSRYCIIEATKHTDRPEASCGLFVTAELLVNCQYKAESIINRSIIQHYGTHIM